MKLYQVREHVYAGTSGLRRTGFTSLAAAEREFRNAVKANTGKRCRITLHQVEVPEYLTHGDWAQILSNDGITPDFWWCHPRLRWQQLDIHAGNEGLAA